MSSIKQTYIGDGSVYLIAGGGKIYADIAARFCYGERPIKSIIDSKYSPFIIQNLLQSNHKSPLEFDYFLFGVEGYSRVTEVQLVRKRMASYLIKSGRMELGGKRLYNVVLPKLVADFKASVDIPGVWFSKELSGSDLISILEQWYSAAVEKGIPEEDARYLKPQATEFKGIIGMNAHALYDFFAVRCCRNAQAEIRDMAHKMLKLCKDAAPDLFKNAGPNCVQLGYCPENVRQNEVCKGKVPTRSDVDALISKHYKAELRTAHELLTT